MDASRAGTGARTDDLPRRITVRVAGPAVAAGAVSLGLVVIGAFGVQHRDVYVSPPPLQSDLQAAPAAVAVAVTTDTPRVLIPPSPTWRVADHLPILRGTSTTAPSGTSTTASGTATTTPRPPAENAGVLAPPAVPGRVPPLTVAPVTVAPAAPGRTGHDPVTDLPHSTTGSEPGSDDLQIPSAGDNDSDATTTARPTSSGRHRDVERPESSAPSTTPDDDN